VDEPKADNNAAPQGESASVASLRHLYEAGVLTEAEFERRRAEAESRPGGSPAEPVGEQLPGQPSTVDTEPSPPAATDRWVCLRCFTANDPTATECSACGLPRGATPPASDVRLPTAARRRSPIWWVLRRFAWVLVVLAIAAGGAIFAAQRGSTGEITRGGNLAIQDVRVGDCFDLKDVHAQQTGDVNAKRCSDPHQFEMIFVGNLPAGSYPTDSEVNAFLTTYCDPAFTAYIGLAYQASALQIFYWTPTTDGWNRGDRAVQCAVFDPLDTALVGSLRGAAR
jgi:Septum formation/Short C-terminal domain